MMFRVLNKTKTPKKKEEGKRRGLLTLFFYKFFRCKNNTLCVVWGNEFLYIISL